MFNDAVLYHIGHFSCFWFGSFTCVMVLTVFLVEICVMLGQESCNEVHSVVVVMPGPAISFFHMVLCFLPQLFGFLLL